MRNLRWRFLAAFAVLVGVTSPAGADDSCPGKKVRNAEGACVCPPALERWRNECRRPCGANEWRAPEGVCECKANYRRWPDGRCLKRICEAPMVLYSAGVNGGTCSCPGSMPWNAALKRCAPPERGALPPVPPKPEDPKRKPPPDPKERKVDGPSRPAPIAPTVTGCPPGHRLVDGDCHPMRVPHK